MRNKVKVTLSLDVDAYCILDTLANEFGLNRSEMVEKLALSCGYNRFGPEGLFAAWAVSFHPENLCKFRSNFYPYLSLCDVVQGYFEGQSDLPSSDNLVSKTK